jgi:hypothetical protein
MTFQSRILTGQSGAFEVERAVVPYHKGGGNLVGGAAIVITSLSSGSEAERRGNATPHSYFEESRASRWHRYPPFLFILMIQFAGLWVGCQQSES